MLIAGSIEAGSLRSIAETFCTVYGSLRQRVTRLTQVERWHGKPRPKPHMPLQITGAVFSNFLER